MALDSDFGASLDATRGIPRRWSLARGLKNLSNRLLRRFTTGTGTLAWAPDDGLDVRTFLSLEVTRANVELIQAKVAQQAERDEGILSARCEARFDGAGTLTLALSMQTADGPFRLVLAATSLTVSILEAA